MIMRIFTLLLILLTVCSGTASAAAHEELATQVVELTVTFQRHNPYRPWEKTPPKRRRAMAVVVSGDMLLTSAQMVGDATLVQAEKFGGSHRAAAKLVHIDLEANLALLSVEEESFFDDLKPVQLAGELPTAGTVSSLRWNEGQLEISTSRISRIEVARSRAVGLNYAALKVTSDLSGGGWSEPVFLDGKLVGLTVESKKDLGKVLPSPLISSYLKAVAGGNYTGFANFGASWQENRDPALAAYLGQDAVPSGVLILSVLSGSTACTALQPRDILLEVDGQELDAGGYYSHPRYGRVLFPQLLIEGHMVGDELEVAFIREGQRQSATMQLRRLTGGEMLIPFKRDGNAPPYLVAGGLVFRELDVDYLMIWGKDWQQKADTRLAALLAMQQKGQRPDRRRIIVLSSVLPNAYNLGYHDLQDMVVEEINGQPVDSLEDLNAGFQTPQDGAYRIGLAPNPTRREIVLDAADFKRANAQILQDYGISEPMRMPQPLPELTTDCGESESGQ